MTCRIGTGALHNERVTVMYSGALGDQMAREAAAREAAFAEKAARAAFVESADASALRKGAADQAAARQREVDNSRLLARQIHEVRPRRFHVRGDAARS